jgi:hypothetical protein
MTSYFREELISGQHRLYANYSKEIVVTNRKPHASITYERDGEWVDVNENILILEDKNRIYLSSEKSYDEDGEIVNVRWLGEFFEDERYTKVIDSNSERITMDLKNEGMYILKLEVFDIYGETNYTNVRIAYEKKGDFENLIDMRYYLGGAIVIVLLFFVIIWLGRRRFGRRRLGKRRECYNEEKKGKRRGKEIKINGIKTKKGK